MFQTHTVLWNLQFEHRFNHNSIIISALQTQDRLQIKQTKRTPSPQLYFEHIDQSGLKATEGEYFHRLTALLRLSLQVYARRARPQKHKKQIKLSFRTRTHVISIPYYISRTISCQTLSHTWWFHQTTFFSFQMLFLSFHINIQSIISQLLTCRFMPKFTKSFSITLSFIQSYVERHSPPPVGHFDNTK